MYNNEYEEYMKNVLGYPMQYEATTYNNNQYTENNSFFPYRYNSYNTNFDSMYPEIYKLLQPMISKACANINYRSFSVDTLESLTNEIYRSIESDDNLNIVNINVRTQEADDLLKKDIKITSKEKRMSISEKNRSKENISQDNSIQNSEAEADTRNCCQNPTLKDLIRILLLNQIINNNPNRPPRPSHTPMPPRPPYRELENPAIYNNFSSNQPYQFFN